MIIEATTTTVSAPWWYVAALAGGFTVLGGLISFFSNYFTKSRELRRADDARWDNDILDGSCKLLSLLEDLNPDEKPARSDSNYAQFYMDFFQARTQKIAEAEGITNRLSLIATDQLFSQALSTVMALKEARWMIERHLFDEFQNLTHTLYTQMVPAFTLAVRNELRAKERTPQETHLRWKHDWLQLMRRLHLAKR